MVDLYELYEYDNFYGKILEKVGDRMFLPEARIEAERRALMWCEDEKPERIVNNSSLLWKGLELWIGESDFGIMIRKVED